MSWPCCKHPFKGCFQISINTPVCFLRRVSNELFKGWAGSVVTVRSRASGIVGSSYRTTIESFRVRRLEDSFVQLKQCPFLFPHSVCYLNTQRQRTVCTLTNPWTNLSSCAGFLGCCVNVFYSVHDTFLSIYVYKLVYFTQCTAISTNTCVPYPQDILQGCLHAIDWSQPNSCVDMHSPEGPVCLQWLQLGIWGGYKELMTLSSIETLAFMWDMWRRFCCSTRSAALNLWPEVMSHQLHTQQLPCRSVWCSASVSIGLFMCKSTLSVVVSPCHVKVYEYCSDS